LLLLLAFHQRAHAFSAGSGACLGGNSNLFGPHLVSTLFNTAFVVTKGSLADGGLRVLMDGVDLITDQVLPFTVGTDYNLRVVGSQPYKGILIRLQASQGVDTSNALLEDTDLLDPAHVCTSPVVGINHNSAVLKNNQGGTIRLDEPSDVFLDITIVNVLDDNNSEFYYSRFALRADLVSARPTTSAPTKQPSLAPSPGPTLRPTRAPTGLPSQSPAKSSQQSVLCVAEGDTCDFDDTCCGDGGNVCVGVCTRFIGQSSKNLDSSQYKLSDGGRDRGSGSVRRKLLKGSSTQSN
jgi:hypothetical protein